LRNPPLGQAKLVMPHWTGGYPKDSRVSDLPCPKKEILQCVHRGQGHLLQGGDCFSAVGLLNMRIGELMRPHDRIGQPHDSQPSHPKNGSQGILA